MGSVKELRTDEQAKRIMLEPGPHHFGVGAWRVSGRFSVGDLKELIPPVEIPQKNVILAITAAAYWEAAADAGFPNCYIGMLSPEGNTQSVSRLLERGELSDTVVMHLANAPPSPLTAEGLAEYHRAIREGDITTYVADAESIFRAGFPLGSSTFKKIFKAVGSGAEYERLATYEETVAALDGIRAELSHSHALIRPELEDVLRAAGLDRVPNPGHLIHEPVLNFTTKFALSGDEDVSEDEARGRMGLDPEQYGTWKDMVRRNAEHQIAYCAERGIVNIDGKVEAVVDDGASVFTDFACTVDENRLMLRHEVDGTIHLLPSNKEIQRAIFREAGIYAAIDDAKAAHGDEWREHLVRDGYVTKQELRDATDRSVELMGQAIATVGNRLLGKEVFDAQPVERWAPAFLPYASREQR